jgi:16S rRNA (cytidine1402-2'-O)-methyltransferase
VLVSTPIGNLKDLGRRAEQTLRAADLILCEDTRHAGRLLAGIGARAPLEALHQFNEDARTPFVLDLVRAGKRVALVSDAGTPLLSDPGYRLTRAAIAAGLPVNAVPGPNAAITALTLSGLPPQPFLFLGFPPPRRSARQAALARLRAAELAGLSATLIWHEAPHRLQETLIDLVDAFGARPAALARELTKRFEEVHRAPLPALLEDQRIRPARGEITLVVGPPAGEKTASDDLDARLRAARAGHSLKDAAALVAAATGLPRRTVYARALALEIDSADEGAE